MTNHKKLIDVTASLERNCLYLEKKRYTKNRSVCKNCPDIGLVWELHAPTDRLLAEVICYVRPFPPQSTEGKRTIHEHMKIKTEIIQHTVSLFFFYSLFTGVR